MGLTEVARSNDPVGIPFLLPGTVLLPTGNFRQNFRYHLAVIKGDSFSLNF